MLTKKLSKALVAAGVLWNTTMANADVVIVIDASGSSPVMRAESDTLVAAAGRHIADELAKQPLGARLLIVTAGEHDKPGGKLLDKRIQRYATSSGDTAKAYANSLPAFLVQQVQALRRLPAEQQSHLTAAVVTVGRMVNAGRGDCGLFMFSDLAEFDGAGSGVRYPRDWKHPLPAYVGFDLKGCTFTAFGAGQGLQPKPAEAILGHWRDWLARHGAGNVVLEKY